MREEASGIVRETVEEKRVANEAERREAVEAQRRAAKVALEGLSDGWRKRNRRRSGYLNERRDVE